MTRQSFSGLRTLSLDQLLEDEQRTGRPVPVIPAEVLSPDLEERRNKLAEVFGAYIARLPARHQEVLRLAFFDGLSYSEIAERLGIASDGSAYGRVKRSLAALVRLVAEDDPKYRAAIAAAREARHKRGRPPIRREDELAAARRVLTLCLLARESKGY